MAKLGKNLLYILILVVVLLSASMSSANAVATPEFPACANPQGTVISSYNSGTHGVAGDTTSYSGSDTVYSNTENTNTQCLCQDNGAGIQTNWWKASGLTQEEINTLVSQGWIYIPDGAAWGLDSSPYLAKNSSYLCRASGGASATNTSSGTTSSVNTILNLASTGNIQFILMVFSAGLFLIALGLTSTL